LFGRERLLLAPSRVLVCLLALQLRSLPLLSNATKAAHSDGAYVAYGRPLLLNVTARALGGRFRIGKRFLRLSVAPHCLQNFGPIPLVRRHCIAGCAPTLMRISAFFVPRDPFVVRLKDASLMRR
jgi:hypothetical protein